ncbi:hypothetical protein JCGZ_11728 [Jatropha curcas]|uniref:Uncharacterized protein n=1 Tax=Jatropha curcas TaxID=180498 RepID=A0A067K5F5_JATCU|nr:RNA polymerase II degradation factor 1 [Jatropha curcas]KDP31352.1 hypothetical protein JCGZ_11728 [Jatropha curcas]
MGSSEIEGKQIEDTRYEKENKISASSKDHIELTHNSSRLSQGTQLAEENRDVTTSLDMNTSPSYRFPSAMFARNKSQAPMEWSAASSESLFSIHMGNMSFTREQSFMGGELIGLPGEISMSAPVSPLVKPSSKRDMNIPSPISKSSAKHKAVVNSETIKENETPKETPKKSQRSASFRRSDVSGASVKSFAFPILTDHKADSSKPNASPRSPSQPQTPKVSQEPESQQKPQLEQPNPGTSTAKPPANAGMNRWFACLPCCSSSRS